jgi:hypothetical protein
MKKIIKTIQESIGIGSITIEGGILLAGIHYYFLYVDNSPVDTKKMILTK